MKKSLLIIAISLYSFCATAQKNDTTVYYGCRIKNDTTTYVGQQTSNHTKVPDCSVFSLPKFPGGEKALHRFIYENLRWPKEDSQGNVYLNVIIEKDGSLSDITVIHGTEPSMVTEALRVAKLSPKWTPAKYKSKPIRYKYTIPFRFNLIK
jgi:hypothetical protein